MSMVFALTIGAATPSHALLDSEFELKEPKSQFEHVASAIQAILDHYNSNPETAYKAACMERLYQTRDSGDNSKLLTLINLEIDKARTDQSREYQVDRVIYGVTERECTKAD